MYLRGLAVVIIEQTGLHLAETRRYLEQGEQERSLGMTRVLL